MSARIASALSYIPADDRELWVSMGMAVKHEEGPDGFDIWDAWSRTADNYNAAAARSVWRSFRGSGITIGSLFHEAKANGWRDDENHKHQSAEQINSRKIQLRERETAEGQERERLAKKAATKAGWILHQCVNEEHAYLHTKGWPKAVGAVWRPDAEQNLLCIPMRINGALVGLQMIDKHGGKKYLSGQRTSEAEFLIDNSGRGAQDWFCEGYATALSLRDCLQALKMRYRIHVAFSAGNLPKLALKAGQGFVMADKDDSGTGEAAALKTGLPYYLPDQGDWNDFHKSAGTFQASQKLRRWIVENSC